MDAVFCERQTQTSSLWTMATTAMARTLTLMEPCFSLCPNEDQRQLIAALDRRLSDVANPWDIQDVLSGLCELGLMGAQLPEERGGLAQLLPTMALIHERLGFWRAHPSVIEETVIPTDLVGIRNSSQYASMPNSLCLDQAIWSGKPTAHGAPLSASGRWRVSGNIVLHRHPSGADGSLILFLTPEGTVAFAEIKIDVAFSARHTMPLQPDLISVQLHDLEVEGQMEVPALLALRPRWAVLRAAELVGWAQSVLDQCVSYVHQREQFGGPIARFQAVQHALSRMLVSVEAARSAVYGAACLISVHHDDANWGHAAHAVLESRSAARFCTQEAIQVHGGMGYTKDCGLDRPLLTVFQIEAQLNQMIDWNRAIRT